MAIADHAISDRAISAPEDAVVVGVSTPGRVVVYAQPVGASIVGAAQAGDVDVFAAPANDVTVGGFPLD